MDLIRTYLDKESTLIYNNKSNNSKNTVWEIVRGYNSNTGEALYSRHIFSIDLSELRNKINTYGLVLTQLTKHTVNFISTIRYREDLIGSTNVDGFLRDSNFELSIYPITETFTDGVNFDYLYNDNSIINGNTNVPNWFYKDKVNTWNQNGTFTGNTIPTGLTNNTQFFEQGNENIKFDITDYINNILFTTTGNTASFGICYSPAYEQTLTGNTNYITSYFSQHCQSFFEPYLETNINSYFEDNRNLFYLDKTNSLCLYTKQPITSVNSVKIYDNNDILYTTLTGNTITQVNPTTYKINLNIPSSGYTDLIMFTDVWNITYNGITKDITNEFTLETEDISISNDDYDNSRFNFSFIGIKQDEIIKQNSGVRKIQVFTKRLYGNEVVSDYSVSNLKYRLYTIQGVNEIEIIPYTLISRTINGNYFEIDIDSLIPQVYFIDVIVERNGLTYGNNKHLKFYVKNLV
jgi:hypothetical protein